MATFITRNHVFPEGGAFYINDGGYAIVKVLNTLGAGDASIVYLMGEGTNFDSMDGFIATSSASRVIADEEGPLHEHIRYSNTSGASWAQVFTFPDWINIAFNFHQFYFQDKAFRNIICAAQVNTVNGDVLGFWTRSGGASWTSGTFPKTNFFWNFAVPAHDGLHCYFVTVYHALNYSVTVSKVLLSDGSAEVKTPTGGFTDDLESGFTLGTCLVGDPNTLYLVTDGYRSIWKMNWTTGAITLLNDGSPGSGSQIDTNQSKIKQITSTSDGTLLATASSWLDTGDPPWLTVYRSVNQGASWSIIALDALLRETTNAGRWYYIAESGGKLFIPFPRWADAFGDRKFTGAYSVDDGATWDETPILLNDDDRNLTQPFDVMGSD